MPFCFFLVATFTFYLAASNDHEQRTPTGSEGNVTSSVILDLPESQISETEAEDERGTLTASNAASDGLDLSWELKTPGASDSVAVRYKDTQISRDGSEVQLPGDSRGAGVGGPEPTAEYQTELFGIKSSQGPALPEAVAVTGTRVCFSEQFFTVSQSRPCVSQTSRAASITLAWLYTNRTHRFHSDLSFQKGQRTHPDFYLPGLPYQTRMLLSEGFFFHSSKLQLFYFQGASCHYCTLLKYSHLLIFFNFFFFC